LVKTSYTTAEIVQELTQRTDLLPESVELALDHLADLITDTWVQVTHDNGEVTFASPILGTLVSLARDRKELNRIKLVQ
jgi:hypothetical protein